MLCETFAHYHHFDFGPVWKEVMDWIEHEAGKTTEEFHCTVAGCCIGITSPTTRLLESSFFEAHKQMVDIQVMLQREEWLYTAPLEELLPRVPYDAAKDIAFYDKPEHEFGRITLRPGCFAMLFPWDAHMPLVAVNNVPTPVRKLVAKIPLNALSLHSVV